MRGVLIVLMILYLKYNSKIQTSFSGFILFAQTDSHRLCSLYTHFIHIPNDLIQEVAEVLLKARAVSSAIGYDLSFAPSPDNNNDDDDKSDYKIGTNHQ